MAMENDSLKRRLRIYENPHSPPSHGSVPAQQKKARSAGRSGRQQPEPTEEERTGSRTPSRKAGHVGVSHHRRSLKAIHHRPKRCGRCGGTNISEARTTAKQVTDIEQMPRTATVTHVCHECVCSDCRFVTAPKHPGIKGTSLGPNLLAFLTCVWGKAVSAGNATTLSSLWHRVVVPVHLLVCQKDGPHDTALVVLGIERLLVIRVRVNHLAPNLTPPPHGLLPSFFMKLCLGSRPQWKRRPSVHVMKLISAEYEDHDTSDD